MNLKFLWKTGDGVKKISDSIDKCKKAILENPPLTQETWSTLNPWRYSPVTHHAAIRPTHQVIKASVRTTCAQELRSATTEIQNVLQPYDELISDSLNQNSTGLLNCPQWHIPSLIKGALCGVGLSIVALVVQKIWARLLLIRG